MANVKKANRVQDTDIKRLNHVGLGLGTIAKVLGCHAATVTLRLKAMNVEPTDTRRSFMDDVFKHLTSEEQEWLSHNLYNSNTPVKDFIVSLIKVAHTQAPAVAAVVPAPIPDLVAAPTQIAPEAVQAAPATVAAPPVVESPVEPEKAAELKVPVCGVCHENPVEKAGEVCTGCQQAPVAKTESLFGQT